MIKSPLHSLQPEGNKFNGIFRGVVESNDTDPKMAGRIKVRIFGVHSSKKTLSEDGTEGIPTSELPWSEPALGLFEGSVSGFGTWTVPLQGSHVFVFFENGNPMKPIYFASAPGITSVPPNKEEGFNDPIGEFPTLERMGEPDFHRLSRGKIENTIVKFKNEHLDKGKGGVDDEDYGGVPKADGNRWSEPPSSFRAIYPNNTVLASHGGLTVEVDSTPGEERFHVYHPSNTYIEINKNGNMTIRNELNKFQIIKGESNTHIILDSNETIDGNKTKLVGKNEIMKVNGYQNETVQGDIVKDAQSDNDETIGGDNTVLIEGSSNVSIDKPFSMKCGSSYSLDAQIININSGISNRKTPLKP